MHVGLLGASLMAETVKNTPATQETLETWVQVLGQEDFPQRRKWQPAPVFLPGEVQGQRSLSIYSPWGHKELDMIEMTEHTECPKITV